MNESNDQIANSSHHLRGIARAEPRAVFSEGHIAHIVQTILDVPVSTDQLEQA